MSPYDIALHLWCSYFATTEAFDRTLPGRWSDWSADEWMPRYDYRATSTRFAREIDQKTKCWLVQLEVEQSDSDAARNLALRFSHARQVELAGMIRVTERTGAPPLVESAGQELTPRGREASR